MFINQLLYKHQWRQGNLLIKSPQKINNNNRNQIQSNIYKVSNKEGNNQNRLSLIELIFNNQIFRLINHKNNLRF